MVLSVAVGLRSEKRRGSEQFVQAKSSVCLACARAAVNYFWVLLIFAIRPLQRLPPSISRTWLLFVEEVECADEDVVVPLEADVVGAVGAVAQEVGGGMISLRQEWKTQLQTSKAAMMLGSCVC